MEQPEEPVRKPSVFMHSLMGCLIADALATTVGAVMFVRAGDYDEQTAFQILVGAGAIGAMVGFEIAARRLKGYGGGGTVAEWGQFWGSLSYYGLTAIVLVASAAITLMGSLIAIAVTEPIVPK